MVLCAFLFVRVPFSFGVLGSSMVSAPSHLLFIYLSSLDLLEIGNWNWKLDFLHVYELRASCSINLLQHKYTCNFICNCGGNKINTLLK